MKRALIIFLLEIIDPGWLYWRRPAPKCEGLTYPAIDPSLLPTKETTHAQ